MNRLFTASSMALCSLCTALLLAGCGKEEDIVLPTPGPGETEQPDTPGDDTPDTPPVDDVDPYYNEPFRPQVHYTPARNWINDPNGMVYLDGTWHLFYQYNPQGNGWGNMSWGHATSTDLMHWKEQPVALVRDRLGDVFSGSCVIDKDNTAGFGAGAMIAFYTSTDPRQQQSMAYSTDGGATFVRYKDNPVVANNDMADFRDPKVFWDEEHHQWVMSLARGWTFAIDFYTSTNLKEWTKSGSFAYPLHADKMGCNGGQWECPDLLTMKAPDGSTKHVLIVSVNPGGPNGGSGTHYFVGHWDGKTFTADEAKNLDGNDAYPLWFDYGCDNYAGVTWSNAPDGRLVFIGWMNNWSYSGDVPCDPWRSAMTLPRELRLVDTPAGLRLSQSVVREIDAVAGPWTEAADAEPWPEADAYQLQVTLDVSRASTLSISNGENSVGVSFNPAAGLLSVNRGNSSGRVNFNNFGRPAILADYSPTMVRGGEMTVDLYIDRSSVELFAADGTLASTNLFFPTTIYNSVSISGQPLKARVRPLKNVWR